SRQRRGTLHRDREKILRLHGPDKTLAQGVAFNILHYQQDFAVVFEHVINAGNIGVIQSGSTLAFMQQTGDFIWIAGTLGGESFEGHGAAKLGIFGAIDFSHPTRSKAVMNYKSAYLCAA